MRAARLALGVVAAALAGCRPNTDLVVPPVVVAAASAAVVEVPPPRADGRLPEDVRPSGYRLLLEIDPTATRFRGEVRIDLDVMRPASAIVLHGSGLSLLDVELAAGDRVLSARGSFRRAAGAERGDGLAEELVIEPTEVLGVGTAELRITYEAPLDDRLRGLYRSERGGKTYAVTQLEPADARRLLPCFDDPTYKVPFELSVVVPRGNLAFANTPIARERDAADDPATGAPRVRIDFEPTRPLPAYLLALAVGPFEVYEGPSSNVPIRLVAPAGQGARGAYVTATASELVDVLARRFGTPFPYPKLDLVAVPTFGAGAMENAGLVTFREELLLVDERSSALARRRAELVIAHELAHQWFGDLVTLRWWNDLWLNEGFASYFESLAVDELHPATRAAVADLADLGAVMDLDSLDAARRVREEVRTVYEAEDAFDAITYSKGSAVLGMLHAYLGDEAFRDGIQNYLAKHAHGTATSDDLFAALGDVSQRDVPAIARSFVDRPGVPLVRLTTSCADGRGKVTLSQRRYRLTPRPAEEALWSIPVCLRYAPIAPRSVGATEVVATSRVCTLLDARSTQLELESCPAWVHPNDEHRGYYRYAMPPEALVGLWRAVRGSGPRERIGVLSNAWALVRNGDLAAIEFLPLLEELRAERDPETVGLLVTLLDELARTFVDDASRPAFQRWAGSILGPIARDVGWERRAGEPAETPLLRETVFDAVSLHGADAALAKTAARRALEYLRDATSGDRDTAAVALRVAARTGGVSFDQLMASLVGRDEPEHRVRVLRALGSLAEPAEVLRTLDLVGTGAVKASDLGYVVRSAARSPDSREALVGWFERNFALLSDKTDAHRATSLATTTGPACSGPARAGLEQKLRPVVVRHGGSLRRLDELIEASAACVDLRERQGKAVARWLEARAGERRGPDR